MGLGLWVSHKRSDDMGSGTVRGRCGGCIAACLGNELLGPNSRPQRTRYDGKKARYMRIVRVSNAVRSETFRSSGTITARSYRQNRRWQSSELRRKLGVSDGNPEQKIRRRLRLTGQCRLVWSGQCSERQRAFRHAASLPSQWR